MTRMYITMEFIMIRLITMEVMSQLIMIIWINMKINNIIPAAAILKKKAQRNNNMIHKTNGHKKINIERFKGFQTLIINVIHYCIDLYV